MKFTILGSTGFIGGTMARSLRDQGIEIETPARDVPDLQGKKLGHVIYAIGLTGNFRQKPDATIEAHVNVLRRLIDGADFDSWLYLSSTRIYGGLPPGVVAREDAVLSIQPSADSLYDLSKLLGESICLSHPQKTVRVARLSNVYGTGQSEHTFLGSILRDLQKDGKVTINQSPESSKDYIAVEDVAAILQQISISGKERIYNVASGKSVTHGELADCARKAGYDVDFTPNAPARIFPPADPARIVHEFNIKFRSVTSDLSRLLPSKENQDKRKGAA